MESIEHVLAIVANYFEVTKEYICQKSRQQPIPKYKAWVAFILETYDDAVSDEAIAQRFGVERSSVCTAKAQLRKQTNLKLYKDTTRIYRDLLQKVGHPVQEIEIRMNELSDSQLSDIKMILRDLCLRSKTHVQELEVLDKEVDRRLRVVSSGK